MSRRLADECPTCFRVKQFHGFVIERLRCRCNDEPLAETQSDPARELEPRRVA